MSTRWIVIAIAVTLAFWLYRRPPTSAVKADANLPYSDTDESQAEYVHEPKVTAQQTTPPTPQMPPPHPSKPPIEPPQDTAKPTPPPSRPVETTYPTRDQFVERFRSQDFGLWLTQSTPYNATSSEDGPSNGNAWEAGIVVTADGEFEYRYWVSVNGQEELKPHSCISIRPPQGDLIVGSAADGSLAVWKLPIQNARIYKIQDKHFFVTYYDFTESRQKNAYGEPISPQLLQAWMYYTRRADGKFVYRGKRERGVEHTDSLHEMRAQEFCRFSYGPR